MQWRSGWAAFGLPMTLPATLTAALLAALCAHALRADAQPAAQELSPQILPSAVSPGGASAAAQAWMVGGPLGAAQLDQLTAPIALYSDALVAQVLMAATHPLQVVEAHRWLLQPGNAALSGPMLLAALQQQPWDLSVKSLVPFTQVLQLMDANLQWTERIGEAFLTQQDAVMDSIQRLRQRAAVAGSLASTPQQNISTLDEAILIDPTSADEVYVPYYDPETVYGSWPWPGDPPCHLAPSAGNEASGGTPVTFGPGVLVLGPLWGWQRWHWRRHMLDVALNSRPGQEWSWRHPPRGGRDPVGIRPVTSRAGPRRLGSHPSTFASNGRAPEGAASQIPREHAASESRGPERPAGAARGHFSAAPRSSASGTAVPAAPAVHAR